MASLVPRSFCWMVCAALLVTFAGCGKSLKNVPVGLVSGRVTLDGQPVTKGCVVNFVPKSLDAELGGGAIQEDGKYVAVSPQRKGLPVGDYQIQILPPPPDEQTKKEDQQKIQGALIETITKKREDPNAPATPIPKVSQEDVVPAKYWTETTSKLKFTVAVGENKADFDLKSQD